MFRKLIGAALAAGIAAVGAKVVKDILDADKEEEAKFIHLDNVVEEAEPEENSEVTTEE